jgi:hypothetical protein
MRRLLDRGRKAGLNAREIYQALTARQPAPGDQPLGKTDINGYVAQIQENGQRVYQQPSAKS